LGIGAGDRRRGHADTSGDHRVHHHAQDPRPPRPEPPPARLAGRGQVHGAGELHATDQKRGDAQEEAIEPPDIFVRSHKAPDHQHQADGQAEVSGSEGDSAVHRSSWSAGAAGRV
jgi:hypothetical protein